MKLICWTFCVVLVITACGGGGNGTDALYADDPTATPSPEPITTPTPSPVFVPTPSPSPSPSPTPVTLSLVQQEVFTPHCASCHSESGEASFTALLLDSETNAFASLVNQPSRFGAGAPTLVIPFDPNGSYLVRKLEGALGISGQRMPPDEPLSEVLIDIVRTWIGLGANEDGTAITSTKVIGTEVLEESGEVSFSLGLSGSISPDSVTPGLIQLTIHGEGSDTLAEPGSFSVALEQSSLIVRYRGDQAFDRLTLKINNPSLGALMDTFGRQVDVDNDGREGGVYSYVYPSPP